MKLITFLGTRPEIIKMSAVIKALDSCVDHVIVHTGQNYSPSLKDKFFDDLDVREPDFYLDVVSGASGASAAHVVSEVIRKGDLLLEAQQPDGILVYGDTNSCLVAYCAKRRGIPIFHMEAGNRCFDFNVPEEVNRKIVDHLSDVNFVLTEHARRYLVSEGLRPERIIKTGSHMPEVLNNIWSKVEASSILDTLGLQKQSFFLASLHREENVDNVSVLKQLLEDLEWAASEFDKKVIFPVHPRTLRRLASAEIHVPDRILPIEPLGLIDFIALQRCCFCLLSDSGTVTEEASILRIPSIMMRTSHERPEGLDVGASILKPSDRNDFKAAILLAVDSVPSMVDVPDYNTGKPSVTVCKTVMGYVDFVKRAERRV